MQVVGQLIFHSGHTQGHGEGIATRDQILHWTEQLHHHLQLSTHRDTLTSTPCCPRDPEACQGPLNMSHKPYTLNYLILVFGREREGLDTPLPPSSGPTMGPSLPPPALWVVLRAVSECQGQPQ